MTRRDVPDSRRAGRRKALSIQLKAAYPPSYGSFSDDIAALIARLSDPSDREGDPIVRDGARRKD